MNLVKLTSLSLCMAMLAACGGSGLEENAETAGSETSTSSGETSSDTNNQSPDSAIAAELKFGSGNGADFLPGQLTLGSSYSMLGGELQITADVVDSNNGNAALAQSYQFQFSSTCSSNNPAQAAFSVDKVGSTSGSATVTYQNINCKNSDTITATLYTADGSQALATASSIVDVSIPKLGFGSGADFISGKISGEVILLDKTSTKLEVNAVDQLNLNAIINSDDYFVQWTSSCSASSFSIIKQSLASANAVTRYDANTCTGNDTATITLYASKSPTIAIDSASVILSIGETASTSEVPKLGTGNGSEFNLGQLDLSANYVLAGGTMVIGVNAVNVLDSNALLKNNYLYKFASSCATGYSRFSSDLVASSIGQVNNTYFNQTCSGSDTITVELYDIAADVNADAPLASASATFNTAMPKLGFASGADFIDGTILGNTNLVDQASTKLQATVIDPLNVNKVLTNADYYISWRDDCIDAESAFSITTQNISAPIETRYDADAVLCKTPRITLELFNQFDEVLDSIETDLTIAEGLEPEQPMIGTGLATSFVKGALELSESPISAKQTVAISVNIVDGKDGQFSLLNNSEYAVRFDSICVTDGRAAFDKEQRRTTSGQVTVYYTASGCAGEDRINATLYAVDNNVVLSDSSLAVATTVLNINNPAINSIEYQDMTTRQIAMKGISYSDLPEVTAVTFLVKDEYNNPASGKKVFFTLSNPSVDATLSGIQNANGEVEVTTNADGIATAFVNSGSSHGLVSVMAEITRKSYGVGDDALELADSDRIRTQSFGISITTGLPVQPSFTMVADKYNPRGWDILGEEVEVTVNLNDRYQNPVPDGTRVNFITDGGKVEPSCETKEGMCSVKWTSAKPLPGFNKDNDPLVKQKSNQFNLDGSKQLHPTNDPTSDFYFNRVPGKSNERLCGDGSLAQDASAICDEYRLVDEDDAWNGGRSGVVTILAYTQGEVDFSDGIGKEGNGRFDDGESFFPMAEAFLDANEDGIYTAPTVNNPFEELIEFDNNGRYTLAPNTYQGGNCTDSARALGHCAAPVHIRQSIQLIMASDFVAMKLDEVVGQKSGSLPVDECVNVYNENQVEFKFSVSDYNGNVPRYGLPLTFSSVGFDIVKIPDPVGNKNDTYAHTFSTIVTSDKTYSNDTPRLFAAHPVAGEAGSVRLPEITDDPRIKIVTTDYLRNVSAGAQIIAFQFLDSCGKPPRPSDIIIFELTGLDVLSYNKEANITIDDVTNDKSFEASENTLGKAELTKPRSDYFQIYGKELRDNGEIFLEIKKSVDAATVVAAEAEAVAKESHRDEVKADYDSAKASADSATQNYNAALIAATTKAQELSEAEAIAAVKAQDLIDAQAARDALPDGDPGIADADQAVADAEAAKAVADDNVIDKQTEKTAADNFVASRLVIKTDKDNIAASAKATFDAAANQAEIARKEADAIAEASKLAKGTIKVRAINRAADGLETNNSFDVRL